ncbi:replication initiator, partial [Streptomyces sp. NPDC004129]
RGAGVVHGVQVERATVRTTWTPWAASARLCLARRWTGWELPAHATTDPQSGTAPPLDISDHARRLVRTAWTLGARKDLEYLRLPAWAHMLGFRGHFSTKSRRYSTTLGALRDARAEWRRAQAAAADGSELEATYVLAHWAFAGTGLSDTEAWLAASLEPAPGTEGEPTA